ncbi:bacitracin resistance protein [Microbacterium sp. 67-17]|jgi:hypothetical protein|uniref:bacitracin resistance protein n=1 Tax=unclassified Microbacterium TaxID=2609290 RepID=UPI00095C8D5D|nr:bacitracin resistance protein [Microbacterium sp. 67-17]OJV94998.1 MAG: hypothetical protein BGO47_09970 [Microbacterium sp. 67-17]
MSENTNPVTGTEAPVSVPPRRAALPVWLIATIAGFFGLFYAYAVWNALAFLISQASGLSGGGWALVLAAVVFPFVVFAMAFAIGWKRRAGAFSLVMLTGLGLVAVFWFNVLAYVTVDFVRAVLAS